MRAWPTPTFATKRRITLVSGNGSSVVYNVLGDIATLLGISNAVQTASSTNQPSMRFDAADDFSGNPTKAGVSGNLNYIYGKNIRMSGNFKFGGTTLCRYWMALCTDTIANLSGSDDLASAKVVGFRFSNTASDTTIKCITRDGTTQTVTSSGIAADTNWHAYDIICDDVFGNVKFYIDGALVATVTATRPASGIVLRAIHSITYDGSLFDGSDHFFYNGYYTVEEDGA